MKKFFIIISIAFFIFIVALFIAGFFIKLQFIKNNVNYKSLSYHFPSALSFEEFEYHKNDSFNLEIKHAEFSWTWISLIKGKPEITSFKTKGVMMNQISGNTESSGNFNIPEFSASNINLENIFFESYHGPDTISLHLPNLHISSIISRESLVIDSLVIKSTNFSYRLHSNTIDTSQGSSSTFFNEIPFFELKHVNLEKGNFFLDDSENKHKISQLDFQFSGLKSTDLLNFEVDKLSFTYQDTLSMNLILANGVVNKQLNTTLDDIRFHLPGAAINVKKFDLKTLQGLNALIVLDNSYLSFGRIKQFYPDIKTILNQDIPDDSLFHLNGTLTFNSSSAWLDSFQIKLYKNTTANISGTIDWSGNSPFFNLIINPFKTSRNDLDIVLARKSYNQFYNWPTAINGSINVIGNSDRIVISGALNTDQGVLNIQSIIKSDIKDKLYYSLDISSDSVRLGEVETILPVKIPYAGIHYFMDGESNVDENTDYFNLNIEGTNLFYDAKKIDTVVFNYYFDRYADTISATVNDELVALDFKMAIPASEYAESFITSKITKLVPSEFYSFLPPGSFSAELNGTSVSNNSNTEMKIAVKALELITSTEHIEFPESDIHFESNNDNLLLTVGSGKKKVIEIKTGKTFPEFKFPIVEWLAAWPESEIHINLKPDDIFFRAFTGHSGTIDIERIDLIKDKIRWKADMVIPVFKYDSTTLKGLTLTVNSNDSELEGNLNLEKFTTPGLWMEPVNITFGYKDYSYTLKTSMLEESKHKYEIALVLDDLQNGFHLKMNEKEKFIIADTVINIINNSGLYLNEKLKITKGDFAFSNKSTLLEASTDGHHINFRIDSLLLDPLVALFLKKENAGGKLNVKGTLNTDSGVAACSGEFTNLKWLGTDLGTLEFSGHKSESEIVADAIYQRAESKATFDFHKSGDTLKYEAVLSKMDLDFINNLQIIPAETGLKGRISGWMNGEYNVVNTVNGILITDHVEVTLPLVRSAIKFNNDSIRFNQDKITFQNFIVEDERANKLLINGNVIFNPALDFDLFVQSDKFNLLSRMKDKAAVSGILENSTDLRITGNPQDLMISGNLKTLPGADVIYTMQEGYNLIDASQTVSFTEFSKEDEFLLLPKSKVEKGVNLDVNIEVSESRITILLDEVMQQSVKLTGHGKLNLRKGFDGNPLLYGTFTSSSGNAFISPPAIPDLTLVIEEAQVTWNGLIDEPVITLKGFKPVKASPKGLSMSFSNSTEVELFKVYVILDQVTLSNFDLEFDLVGGTSETTSYLQSLPKDTRQALAINLLVFGKFGSEESLGNTALVDQMTEKLNEIARRNLKNSDLSFSTVSYESATSDGGLKEKTDLNYSLSKGFIHDKLTFSVGGSVGFYLEDLSEIPTSNLIGDVEMIYKLKEKPILNVKASRKNVYRGIIDGVVTEASAGLFFHKSYAKFTDFFKSAKNDTVK